MCFDLQESSSESSPSHAVPSLPSTLRQALPVQPRLLRHYHDRSDEPQDLCHGTTMHLQLIEFLLQRYYTYRSPASCSYPRCTDLARTARERKAACTLLPACLSALCCSTIADCFESDQAVRNSTAALHGGHHGIESALAVAKILESGERRNPWNLYALLRSYALSASKGRCRSHVIATIYKSTAARNLW
jgi:hypothetical protein